jgi:hypothetical protein
MKKLISITDFNKIKAEIGMVGLTSNLRIFALLAAAIGLLFPLHLIQQGGLSRCILSQQLLVSDPLTKGKSELSSGLEMLGFSGKSDDPTLKAVLESQTVTTLLGRKIVEGNPGDKEVYELAKLIKDAADSNKNDPPLQVKQQRGDRFQDLSIITISLRGKKSILERIRNSFQDFYQEYGTSYRTDQTKIATSFANSQISRLLQSYREVDDSLKSIRIQLGGFDPTATLKLAQTNYDRLSSAATEAQIDEPQGFVSSTSRVPLSNIIASKGLQPVITSDSFRQLVTGYNSVKAKYQILRRTRAPADQELKSFEYRLRDLGKQIQEQLSGTTIRPDDIPSTKNAYEAFEKEVVSRSRLINLQIQTNKDKQFYAQLAARAQALQARYIYLMEEQKSTLSMLSSYRQLSEKLLLDSAKELTSWRVIGSTLRCDSMTTRLLSIAYILTYTLALILLLSSTVRALLYKLLKFDVIKNWMHGR